MSNPKIHVNRKFHILLSQIVKVVQKKNGRTWVYYTDAKFAHPRIAIHKGDSYSLLYVINTAKIMNGEKQIELIIEK